MRKLALLLSIVALPLAVAASASLRPIDERRSADPETLRTTGERIRRARAEAGLSEDALGECFGVSGVTIHLYETGMTDPGENLAAIAEATGRPLSWFAGDEEAEEPSPELESEPQPEEGPELEAESEQEYELPPPEPDPPSPEHADAPPPTTRLHARNLGGNAMIVDTPNGGQVRAIASRDTETGKYVSAYEVMTETTWEGKPLFVWEAVQTYRPCQGVTVEECLEATLAEIEAGPRPPEPEEPERPLAAEELTQVTVLERKRHRGLFGFLRR
jgi:transcriptional regulator with XRE-family HTH domain